jgi:hypothetical protein
MLVVNFALKRKKESLKKVINTYKVSKSGLLKCDLRSEKFCCTDLHEHCWDPDGVLP